MQNLIVHMGAQMPQLYSLTATEMRAALGAGETSARALVASALARVDAVNPRLNAIVQRCDEEALAQADAQDRAFAAGEVLGPMAGVPVTIKVITDQAGFATTNGLRLQQGLMATQDSPVVANLRRAGAIIIGRSNTPAFSLRWFTRNSLHGATINPRNPDLTPGGSSGGAAAAVASGMGPIGHGTDIAGSVRYPAYACGVHGLRPSLGRVPSFNATGADRLIGAQLMAVSGPIARSIADLRLALTAMAVPDSRDPWSMPVPLMGPAAPRRLALCIAPEGMVVDPAIRAALRQAADKAEAAGWQVDEVQPPPLREAVAVQLRLWLAEMRRTGGAAIYAEGDPDAIFVYENLCRHAPEPDLNGFMDLFATRSRLVRQWRAFFADYPVLLCPVSGELPFADHRDVASQSDFDAVIEAQTLQIGLPLMGLPGLTVTTGAVGNTPVGVQLVADQFREDLLLDLGDLLGADIPVVG